MRPVVLAVLATWALAAPARAQAVPETITFSARLESGGVPLSGKHDFDFALWTAPAPDGGVVWGESLSEVLVTNGVVDVELGTLDSLAGAFDGHIYYLEVTVDGTKLAPRTEISSVPYARRAASAVDSDRLGGFLASTFLHVGSALLCPAAQHLVGLDGATGNVVCAADATAGSGLQLAGNQLSVITCAAGQVLTEIGAPGSQQWGCGTPTSGDITGIATPVAGGLSGGVSSGIASLGIMLCPVGQTLQYDGPQGWLCAKKLDGLVSADGSGILLGGADNTVVDVGYTGVAVDTSVIQKRVTGTCPARTALTGINGDGTVVCTAQPAFKASPVSSDIDVDHVNYADLATVSTTLPSPGVVNVVVNMRWINPSSNGADHADCIVQEVYPSSIAAFSFTVNMPDPGDQPQPMYFSTTQGLGAIPGLHTYTLRCTVSGGASAHAVAHGAQLLINYYPNSSILP